jgi:hypothetical protein
MNETRRGLFRYLGFLSTVPAGAKLEIAPAPATEVEIISINDSKRGYTLNLKKYDKIYLAFIRLGLIAVGEVVSRGDYDLASKIMEPYPQWNDEDLAFALRPYYRIYLGDRS